MSAPATHLMRVRSLYILIAMNVAMLFVGIGVALYVAHLRAVVDRAEQRGYQGCLRGNVVRESVRFSVFKLGSPDRAALPELQEQDCAALYPGGKS